MNQTLSPRSIRAPIKYGRSDRVFACAAFLLFALMLVVSWRRWTSPITDSGREMDLPLRLLRGELLYRDINYLYTPFSPYFNSLLYRLFGIHQDVLLASGIFFSILITVLCYRIARRILDPSDAAIATMAVILLCVFKPSGNLISPYGYSALHGTAMALGTLLFSLRYAEKRSLGELIMAGVMIGLAAVTKQEFALASAVTVTAAVIYLERRNLKGMMVGLMAAAAPALIVAVPVFGFFFYRVDWRILIEDCHLLYTHLPASLVFYNSHRTGLDRPLFSLIQMVGAGAVGIAAMSAIAFLGDRTRQTWRRTGLLLIVSLLVILTIKLVVGNHWDGSPLRALPFLLIAILISYWRRGEGSARGESEPAALFMIAAYSLAILARVALRVPSGGAYGGFFLPTSLILFAHLFIRGLPQTLERWTSDPASGRRARQISLGLLGALLIVTAVVFGVRYRRVFNYRIVAPHGCFYAPRASGREIADALSFIKSHTQSQDPIAVFPEGADLAFLTGRRMPLRVQIFLPGFLSPQDELDLIEKIGHERVRYILIVNRPMREFGAEAFGRDFCTILGAWIEQNFRQVETLSRSKDPGRQIGDPEFFIKVFERNRQD